MKLTIIDNDGFLALVDSNKYHSYVTEDWEFEQLISHFIDQSNKGRMIMWRTCYQGDKWNVNFPQIKSEKIAFREFESQIEVTDNGLCMTEYADLTMAASYKDSKIPSNHNSNLILNLENGLYNVLIRQLFNPDKDYLDILEHFEIVFNKTIEKTKKQLDKITWFNDL